jgi:putative nucleotidyltransferase with HDIG domain
MQPSEIRHSLEITRRLIASGEAESDLLAAALLHDVGKSRSPLNLWERAIVVLAKRLIPGAFQRWGASEEMRGFKRIFVVAEQHAAWGAEMAAAAGASKLTARLIRQHQEVCKPVLKADLEMGVRTREDYLLYQLQLLDEES